jgi:glutamyl-tRNA reductase
VSYAAVELARKVFGNFHQKTALLMGAGETAEITAENLKAQGVSRIIVANRTAEKAEALARHYGGLGIGLEDLDQWLAKVDVVVSSTASQEIIVDLDTVKRAMRIRKNRPLFMVDIAVPRDIDPEVGKLDNVFLYDIDDLNNVVEANIRERQREAKRVQRIIEDEGSKFRNWLATQAAVPYIKLLRHKAETIRKSELERALNRMPDLTEKEKEVVTALTSLIVNKILNEPTQKIKKLAAQGQGEQYIKALIELFDLNQDGFVAGKEFESKKNANEDEDEIRGGGLVVSTGDGGDVSG